MLRDPEYRNMIKESLLLPAYGSESDFVNLPVPKEGDIVKCPGKWQDETVLGRIRNLRYVSSTEKWMVDVVQLKEGKSDDVYCVDKTSVVLTASLDELVPVTAFFLRSENGYKVTYKRNTTEILIKAPKYRALDGNFSLPSKVHCLLSNSWILGLMYRLFHCTGCEL